MRVLSHYSVIPTGLRHGTVTVLTGEGSLEVTTFREDGSYSDYRHPDEVRFAKTIEEDLSRRDFTINALAWNEKRGLIDPWGGRSDLRKGVIRTVGDANQRFREDALRIFRGLRLSAELSFYIEDGTSAAMSDCKDLLRFIAPERLQVELNRLLVGENALSVMRKHFDVLLVVVPEFAAMDKRRQLPAAKRSIAPALLDDALLRMSCVSDDVAMRLAALLRDLDNAMDVLKRLRYDNATIDRVGKLIIFQDEKLLPEKRSVWRAIRAYGQEVFLDGMRLRAAGEFNSGLPETAVIAGIACELIQTGKVLELKDLAIDGHDLLERGYKGKAIGDMLERLLENVCVDGVPNTRESLLGLVDDITGATS